jgi:hypothetical protein
VMIWLHTSFFHKVSIHFYALRQQGASVYVPGWYHVMSCSCSQVLGSRIMSSSVSNFPPWSASFRAPNRWKFEGARSGCSVDGITVSNKILLMAFWVFILVCSLALLCWSKISVGF